MQVGDRSLTATDLRVTTSVQVDQLGAVGQTEDGRWFRYGQAGASQIPVGQLAVTPAVVANHQGISAPSQAASNLVAGSTQLVLTLGATAATANQYADGFLVVATGTGAGQVCRISGNTSGTSGGTITVTLVADEALVAAVATGGSSTFNLAANNYANLVTSTTLGHAAGFASTTIPANNFGWFQTHGFGNVLAQGAVTKSYALRQSSTTAGAVVVNAAVSDQTVAYANEAITSTQWGQAWICID